MSTTLAFMELLNRQKSGITFALNISQLRKLIKYLKKMEEFIERWNEYSNEEHKLKGVWIHVYGLRYAIMDIKPIVGIRRRGRKRFHYMRWEFPRIEIFRKNDDKDDCRIEYQIG